MSSRQHMSATKFLDDAILISWLRMDKPDIPAHFFKDIPRELIEKLFLASTGMGGTELAEKAKLLFSSIERSHSPADDAWHRDLMKMYDKVTDDSYRTAQYIGGVPTIPYMIERNTMATSMLFAKMSWVAFTPIAVPLGWRTKHFQDEITTQFASFAFHKKMDLQEDLLTLKDVSDQLAVELLADNPTIFRFCMSPNHEPLDLG